MITPHGLQEIRLRFAEVRRVGVRDACVNTADLCNWIEAQQVLLDSLATRAVDIADRLGRGNKWADEFDVTKPGSVGNLLRDLVEFAPEGKP